MKQFFQFLFIGLLSVSLNAQNLQRSSLGSSGSSTEISSTENTYYVSQSVGQNSVIGTLSNGENTIRQGYQQPPISVEVVKEDTSDINAVVFPNPVETSITVQFSEELNSTINVFIYDISGKVILNTTKTRSNSFNIDMSSYSSGVYLLNLTSGSRTFTARLIKK